MPDLRFSFTITSPGPQRMSHGPQHHASELLRGKAVCLFIMALAVASQSCQRPPEAPPQMIEVSGRFLTVLTREPVRFLRFRIRGRGYGTHHPKPIEGSTDGEGFFWLRSTDDSALFNGAQLGRLEVLDRGDWQPLEVLSEIPQRSAENRLRTGSLEVALPSGNRSMTQPVQPTCGPQPPPASQALSGMLRQAEKSGWSPVTSLGSFNLTSWDRPWGALLCVDVRAGLLSIWSVGHRNHSRNFAATYDITIIRNRDHASFQRQIRLIAPSAKGPGWRGDPGPELERWLRSDALR